MIAIQNHLNYYMKKMKIGLKTQIILMKKNY